MTLVLVTSKRASAASRRKRPSVIHLTASVTSSCESTEGNQTEQKVSRKRERSRKGAPKRFVQNSVTSEECGVDSQTEGITSLPQEEKNNAGNEEQVRPKRRRREKISVTEELSLGSENEDSSDKEFKPTGILHNFIFICYLHD